MIWNISAPAPPYGYRASWWATLQFLLLAQVLIFSLYLITVSLACLRLPSFDYRSNALPLYRSIFCFSRRVLTALVIHARYLWHDVNKEAFYLHTIVPALILVVKSLQWLWMFSWVLQTTTASRDIYISRVGSTLTLSLGVPPTWTLVTWNTWPSPCLTAWPRLRRSWGTWVTLEESNADARSVVNCWILRTSESAGLDFTPQMG